MEKWISPDHEQIAKQIDLAGGRVKVSEELQKTTRAIDYWRFGKRKINYSDWKQICIMANS